MSEVTDFDIEELQRAILGLNDEAENIEEEFLAKYGIDHDGFAKCVKLLMPLTAISQSKLTKKVYRGFAVDGIYMVKEEINEING